MKNTPYDDVFRTLLNDCKCLIIPLINEAFRENYTGEEEITFFSNEHYLNRQDGAEEERITDSCFSVQGRVTKKYHLECQSTVDNSMMVRIFEYDAQIALDDSALTEDTLVVTFPNSAILYLRSNSKTPDMMKICIKTPGGEIMYEVQTIKVLKYSLQEIFDKRLFFLIPFYIFAHESRFPEYDENENKLDTLLDEYEYIRNEFEELSNQRVIDEYTKCTIFDMATKVVENLAKKHDKVKKGVKAVMVGKVLDYEAKRIKNEGKLETLIELVREGLLPIEEAAKRLQKSVDEVKLLL